MEDLFGGGGGGFGGDFGAPAAPAVPSYPVLGEKEGLVVRGGFTRSGGAPVLDLVIDNNAGSTPVTAMALKFNVNVLGLSPAGMTVTFTPIAVGTSGFTPVPLVHAPALLGTPPAQPDSIHAALRDNTSGRVLFFQIPIAYGSTFSESGALDKAEYGGLWRGWGADKDTAEVAKEVATTDQAAVRARLAAGRVFYVTERPGPDPSLTIVYFSARALDPTSGAPAGATILAELTFKAGLPAIKVVVKTAGGPDPLGRLAMAAIKALLK